MERWIEKCFKGCLGDYRKFFEKIGFEQSICRAYRLWLEDKFFEDEFLMGFSEFILSVSNEELYSVWADETIAAVIYSDKLKEILKEFKKQILSQTQILNKICFMIRVAAKRLDKSLKKLEKSMRITEQSAFIQLKPEGNCWKEYICFLYENKEALPSEFYPHCNSLLSEWVEVISLKNDILPGAREAGLLAIYIIKKMLMDKFPDKEATKRLLKVSMCCYGSIRKEFNDFIESIVFDEECREKYGNIENLMMYLLTDFSCGYIAKYDSQLLVRIAKREWVICRYKLLCENNHRYSDYWHFWTLFTKIAKEISVKLNKGEDYRFRRECELLKEYMYVDYLWQPVDYQNQPVREGVEYICSFAKETIQNPIVYEGLASLMYHFPDSYLEKGIAAQSDVSEVELAYNYQKSLNSAFYMENNIYAWVIEILPL